MRFRNNINEFTTPTDGKKNCTFLVRDTVFSINKRGGTGFAVRGEEIKIGYRICCAQGDNINKPRILRNSDRIWNR